MLSAFNDNFYRLQVPKRLRRIGQENFICNNIDKQSGVVGGMRLFLWSTKEFRTGELLLDWASLVHPDTIRKP